MSKYCIAGRNYGIRVAGQAVFIRLSPAARFTAKSDLVQNMDMVLFRPIKDDGRAELAYFKKTIEVETSLSNPLVTALCTSNIRKRMLKVEFVPTKNGDTTIWVCGMNGSGQLNRKSLNRRIGGLKITAIY